MEKQKLLPYFETLFIDLHLSLELSVLLTDRRDNCVVFACLLICFSLFYFVTFFLACLLVCGGHGRWGGGYFT